MKIEKAAGDDYVVLHLKGEFDTFHCPLFLQEIDGLVAGGARRVVLNMRLLAFINSTGLGAIVKARKKVAGAGGEVVLSRPSHFVKTLFEKVGFDRLFRTFEDDDAAVAALRAKAGGAVPAGETTDEEESAIAQMIRGAVDSLDPGFLFFSPADPAAKRILGRDVGIARLAFVDDHCAEFHYGGKKAKVDEKTALALFRPESEMNVKFRLPLYKRNDFFEVPARVEKQEAQKDGSIRVRARFTNVPEADLAAIRQFVTDMRFLKGELRTATGGA